MIKTGAIVLSHLKFGESSVIATLYTEHMGRQSILVKGAFGKKTPMRASLFRPLYLLDITLRYSNHRKLQYISDVSISTPFLSIPYDPMRSSIALFVSEVLFRTLREEGPDPALFAFLSRTIQLLDLNRFGTANFHILFLLRLTRFLGFWPQPDFALGLPVPDVPPEHLDDDNAWLNKFLQLHFDELGLVELSHEQRNELLDIILAYYHVHLEGMGQLHSLSVLKSVFA